MDDRATDEKEPKPYADYGFANCWRKNPEAVKRCRKLGHKTTDVDVGPPMRGTDHVVTCDVCRIRWHYDSSD
jgi:hypothetical protein